MCDFVFVIAEQILNLNTENSIDERLLTRKVFWSAQPCNRLLCYFPLLRKLSIALFPTLI